MVAERFPELQYGHHKKIYIGTYYHQMVSEQWAPIWRRMAPDSALAAAGIVNMPRLEEAMHATVAHRPANIVQWLFSEAWLRGQS